MAVLLYSFIIGNMAGIAQISYYFDRILKKCPGAGLKYKL
jgi:hypothetical protein